ncbi:YqaJ viral recombinase family protein [Planctomonas psychrotolerans]|uniref:YqaJ viral recombinase family protein n=1 Tax=Planctomonas psychrotolerans TaxID=2528712 RepID=UPI001239CB58|nr:YqaJ viral recombinase family protein [Planctomonas psychrotolerans]
MLTFPWEEEDQVPAYTPPHVSRIVAHSTDRVGWMRARSRGITATDVARLSSPAAIDAVAHEKLHGSRFGGNAYTDHGRVREPEIARWVKSEHDIDASAALFHAHGQRRHLATPDGVGVRAGSLVLAEIKTTNKEWRSIPRSYLRQVWWQQYVLGAERTLLVWERHIDFVPLGGEPHHRWIDRDDAEIDRLVQLANTLISVLHREANALRR